MFASYRKDDFADPDGFINNLGQVLERYTDAVIRECCSPLAGIVRKSKWPPSIAEIVEFCDAEVARTERLKRFSAMRFEERQPRPVDPAARANLLVTFAAPDYPQMAEWAQHHKEESRFDPRGVWVPLHIYTDRNTAEKPVGFRQFTAAELKMLYTKPLPGEPA